MAAMKLSFVTLGARNLVVLRRFYGTWGWTELPDSTDDWAGFDAGGTRLALYPMTLLRDEAAPAAEPPPPRQWNGITLAINVATQNQVEVAYRAAIAAGASRITDPQAREWGGYSGYVADPEGNRWEIAWAPNLDARFTSD